MNSHAAGDPILIRLIVAPDFNLSATMAFVDPFRAANYLAGAARFRWSFHALAAGEVRASNGARIIAGPLPDERDAAPDFLIVSSSWAPEAHYAPAIRSALRRAATRNVTLGGIDTGAFFLAEAGLLKGRRATVHYEHIDAFQELFPETETTEALFEFDGPRMTCAGGAASLDFGLHILRGVAGAALANSAARYVFAPGLRDDGAPQNPDRSEPLGRTAPAAVRRVIALMERHLEAPLSITEIATAADIPERSLHRLFTRHVGSSPSAYYRDIRLDRARGLVTQTDMPMSEIAFACGFASQVHFSRAYKARFGLPPARDRIDGRVPFEFRAWPMHRSAGGAP